MHVIRRKRHEVPIWHCSRWGLPCRSCCHVRGGLLLHRFTFSPQVRGSLFSVALSLGLPPPGVTRHRFMWSPDFPPPWGFPQRSDRPAIRASLGLILWALSVNAQACRKAKPGQPRPIKSGAGVNFPPRCGFRVGDHICRVDVMASHDTAQQSRKRVHERRRKRALAIVIKLNPNRMRVDIDNIAPGPCPGVPCAILFGHKATQCAVAINEIMGRDLELRVTQARAGGVRTLHRGIMDQDQAGPCTVLAWPKIGRWMCERVQLPTAARNGAGSQPQAKPSPSGSMPRGSRRGPPRPRKSRCASSAER